MPQQLRISRNLEFVGQATHGQNIEGPIQPKIVHFHDHFLRHTIDTTQLYTVTEGGTSDAVEISAAVGGQCRFKSGTGDSDSCSLATALNYEDDKYAVCEARIKIADVSLTAVFFGFNDANTESATKLPIDFDGGSETFANTDQNSIGFVIDADYLTSSIMCCGVAAGSTATAVDSGTDWVDNEWHTLRIETTPDAYATFYLDGTAVGWLNDAVTSGTDLCMTMYVGTRTTGGQYVYLDRWDTWQDE